MSVNINASVILNNLAANNSYVFSSTKKTIKYNNDAADTSQNAYSLKQKLKALKDIKTSDGGTVRTQNKIKNFVDTYNDLMSSADNVSDSKKLNKYKEKMEKLFSEYETSLKNIGITKTSSNKLKFDTTDFSEVTAKKLEAVFGSDEHFVSDSIKYAKAISSAAKQSLNTPENVLATTTVSVSSGSTALALADRFLAVSANNLYLSDYDNIQLEALVEYLKDYTRNYNDTIQNGSSADINTTERNYINAMKTSTLNAKDSLSAIGMTVNDDGSLYFDETTAVSYDDVKKLFGTSSSYGKLITNYSEKLFSSLVQAESFDINVDYYA